MKVGRISDFLGMWQAYARHIPKKSGFFKMFREVLIMVKTTEQSAKGEK